MITRNVRKAFSVLGDIAQTVTLTEKNATAFDFANSTATLTTPTVKTVKGIKLEKKTREGGLEVTLLMKTEDIEAPDTYDTITLANGDIWNTVPPASNNGYVTTVRLVKGA
jgi:LysM repeat protein